MTSLSALCLFSAKIVWFLSVQTLECICRGRGVDVAWLWPGCGVNENFEISRDFPPFRSMVCRFTFHVGNDR
jgi:hypothetical protein